MHVICYTSVATTACVGGEGVDMTLFHINEGYIFHHLLNYSTEYASI